MEVGNDQALLKRKLETGEDGTGQEFTYASAEGKAYALIRIRLFDEADLPDMDHRLKGLKVIIGDAVSPPAPVSTSLHTVTRSTVSSSAPGALSAGSTLDWLRRLGNILVNPGESAVESFGQWIGGQLEAAVGIPRTFKEFIGFTLKRIADGIIIMFPLPGSSAALLSAHAEELRATVIGMMLGIPRGIYAMGRDTIDDLKQIFWDLPRALFNFIAKDPKFALQVLGSVASPIAGKVMYELDPEFRRKITEAFSKFKGFMSLASKIISGLWTALMDSSTRSAITSAIGDYFYNEFEKLVGGIATDYLLYAKNGLEYRFFLGAFIGGDILGYILVTIGVEVLMAWFTAGIGNIVSALAKFGKLGRIAGKALQLFHKVITFIQKIKDRIWDFVGGIAGRIKEGIGRVFMSLFKVIERFVHAVDDKLLIPMIEAIVELAEEVQERITKMLYRLSEDVSEFGDRVGFMADSIITEFLNDPPTRNLKEFFSEFLDVLSYGVAKPRNSLVEPNLFKC